MACEIVIGDGGGCCGWCPIMPWGDPEKVCCDFDREGVDNLDGLVSEALRAATELVWSMSGRRFGFCLERFLPCAQPCPVCPDSCNCCIEDLLRLPRGKVCAVSRFVVGGVDQPIDGINLLYRGGEVWASNCDGWPRVQCQASGLFLADCDCGGCGVEDNWWVEFVWGEPVPVLGDLAVEALACELVYSCVEPSKCSLPSGVSSVSRQGLSYTVDVDSVKMFESGVTGLGTVDRFLKVANPSQLVSAPEFVDPQALVCDPIAWGVGCSA